MSKKIAVYGSLRKDEYNYSYFNKAFTMEYTGTHTIDGLDLYDLGPYPAAVKGQGKLVVDTFDIDDECYSRINGMEIGAGYYAHTVSVGGVDHTIWLQKDGYEERRVEGGDWSKYLRQKEEARANRESI